MGGKTHYNRIDYYLRKYEYKNMIKSFWRIHDDKNDLKKIIEDMGFIENINPQALYQVIKKLLENKIYYQKIVQKCNNLIDRKEAKQISNVIMGENAKS